MDMKLILRYTNIIADQSKMSFVLGDDFDSLRSDWASSGAIGGGRELLTGHAFEAGLQKSGKFCTNTSPSKYDSIMFTIMSFNSGTRKVALQVTEQPEQYWTDKFKLESIHIMDYLQCLKLSEIYRV